MEKVKLERVKLGFSLTVTKNLGNYESIKVGGTFEAEVPGDKVEQAREQIWDELNNDVAEKTSNLMDTIEGAKNG